MRKCANCLGCNPLLQDGEVHPLRSCPYQGTDFAQEQYVTRFAGWDILGPATPHWLEELVTHALGFTRVLRKRAAAMAEQVARNQARGH